MHFILTQRQVLLAGVLPTRRHKIRRLWRGRRQRTGYRVTFTRHQIVYDQSYSRRQSQREHNQEKAHNARNVTSFSLFSECDPRCRWGCFVSEVHELQLLWTVVAHDSVTAALIAVFYSVSVVGLGVFNRDLCHSEIVKVYTRTIYMMLIIASPTDTYSFSSVHKMYGLCTQFSWSFIVEIWIVMLNIHPYGIIVEPLIYIYIKELSS